MFHKLISTEQDDPAWQWHVQLLAERVFSPVRIISMAFCAAWWMWSRHVPTSHNLIEWVVLVSGSAFAVVTELVLRRDALIARAFPLGSVLADLALIGASVWASGGRDSPFQSFLLVGAIATALRVSTKASLCITPVYVVLTLLFADVDSAFTDAAVTFIVALGLALWSDRLRNEYISAVRDPITGAYSRSFGLVHLQSALAQTTRPITVAVIDVDRFKSVNDTYGHAAGDLVLRIVAHIFMGVLRASDFLSRTGGDEFMIAFLDTDAKTGAMLGERVRKAIESTPIGLRGSKAYVRATVSVGIAESSPGQSASALIEAADRAMYDAKASRNRVVSAESRSISALPAFRRARSSRSLR